MRSGAGKQDFSNKTIKNRWKKPETASGRNWAVKSVLGGSWGPFGSDLGNTLGPKMDG